LAGDILIIHWLEFTSNTSTGRIVDFNFPEFNIFQKLKIDVLLTFLLLCNVENLICCHALAALLGRLL